MADPADLLGAWRDLAGQIGNLATSAARHAGGAAPDVLGTLQRQAELLEQVLRRQVDLEQDLVRRAFAPAQATYQMLENGPSALRAQATAFRAVAASFTQAADVLEIQATALEQTLATLRAPVTLADRGLRSLRRSPRPPAE